MTAFFPFKTKYSTAIIGLRTWNGGDVTCVNEDGTCVKVLTAFGERKTTKITLETETEEEVTYIEEGTAAEHVLNAFFEWTGGEVDYLWMDSQIENLAAGETEQDVIRKISELLASKPIKVKLLRQSVLSTYDLNSPLDEFFRNYIDFKMYATMYKMDGQPSFVISDKLVNCEFLYFDVKLTNSEVLVEGFKGWGLVLRQEDPIINFEFLKKVFYKWYSCEETQWKYLCVACNVTLDSCESLFSLGKKVDIQNIVEQLPITEYEIKREDGEICRLGGSILNTRVAVSDQEPKLFYLYVGECTDEIFIFHSWRNNLD